MKQTKFIKVMIFTLLLIPVVLVFTGVVQTFVLKDAQNKLISAQTELALAKEKQQRAQEKHEFAFNPDGSISDEFLKEHYKHSESDSYGDDGDVNIELN